MAQLIPDIETTPARLWRIQDGAIVSRLRIDIEWTKAGNSNSLGRLTILGTAREEIGTGVYRIFGPFRDKALGFKYFALSRGEAALERGSTTIDTADQKTILFRHPRTPEPEIPMVDAKKQSIVVCRKYASYKQV